MICPHGNNNSMDISKLTAEQFREYLIDREVDRMTDESRNRGINEDRTPAQRKVSFELNLRRKQYSLNRKEMKK